MKPTPPPLLSLLLPLARAVNTGPPKGVPTKTDAFPWTNPFDAALLSTLHLSPACTAERTFAAAEYLLHDLRDYEPLGLRAYANALRTAFAERPYPGGWDGVDPHMYERPLLRMDYGAVPLAVREWVEGQERGGGGGKGLFAVYVRPEGDEAAVRGTAAVGEPGEAAREGDAGKVVVFAPGALYHVLPLWVAEGSECEGSLLDLDKYSPEPKDAAVVAWTTSHTKPKRGEGKREISFTVRAQLLAAIDETEEKAAIKGEQSETDGSRAPAPDKDEL